MVFWVRSLPLPDFSFSISISGQHQGPVSDPEEDASVPEGTSQGKGCKEVGLLVLWELRVEVQNLNLAYGQSGEGHVLLFIIVFGACWLIRAS